jgi:hypothetical protein
MPLYSRRRPTGVPGTKGIMLNLDDFVVGMDQFDQPIQPLMAN